MRHARHTPAKWTRLAAPLLALAVVAAGCSDAMDPTAPAAPTAEADTADFGFGFLDRFDRGPFEVMTRNVYLGGNTSLVFGADFTDPVAVTTAAATVWGQVQASNIPARAAAIVEEIDEARPHVVSVQEAFRFELLGPDPRVIDWIDALEAEIALQGAPYRVEAIQAATSAVLPVSATELVRFTDRIAVLVHDDVSVLGVDQGMYDARLLLASAPPPIGDVIVERGWIRLTTEHRGVEHHVIATHLETQGIPGLNEAQGLQLLSEVAHDLDGFTIVAGDLNSDAAAAMGDPSWTPTYGNLTDAGFVDTWLKTARSRFQDGFTCCHDPLLLNPTPELDERIDFVLLRGPEDSRYHGQGSFRAKVVGDEVGDRLATGQWPSDHAGLSVSMRIPVVLARLPGERGRRGDRW